jgi:hypothetical protein
MKSPFLTRLLFVSAALVVGFAAVFTLGEISGAWPESPARFFRNSDFVAGFLFIGVLVLAAILSRRRSPR